MSMDFQVDETSKVPIYRQIADWFDEQITSGKLPAGHRLLTERALCAELQVARGTVKNAYIELEKRGRIEKIQGRGTFVVGGSAEKEHETAVNAIHRVLDQFRVFEMGEQEIDEIVRRVAWNRLPEEEKIRVVWVDCSPELLANAVSQIAQVCRVVAKPYLVDEVVRNPKVLKKPFDLIATSQMHFKELRAAIPHGRLEQVALSVKNQTVSAMARIAPQDEIAVLYRSRDFLRRVLDNLDELEVSARCDTFSVGGALDDFYRNLGRYRAVIVPPDYQSEEYIRLARAVQVCKQTGVELIPFEYLLDKGSLIHLKEQAQERWLARAKER